MPSTPHNPTPNHLFLFPTNHTDNRNLMSKNKIILVIKVSDIDVSSLTEDKRDIKSRGFKDAVYT
jgi:hypothetical protein